jgi:hypothetical protein
MQTHNTKAGKLTEQIMARIWGKVPELTAHEYNRVYECVLAELQCHEATEQPAASVRLSNDKLRHGGDNEP